VLRHDGAGRGGPARPAALRAGHAQRPVLLERDVDERAAGHVAEQAADGAGEVARVGCSLEADHVGAEQALDDLGAPGQLGVDAVGRERDVVEEADREVGAQLAQHLRHELQLVVLHPHGRAVCRGLRARVGEALVDLDVGVPPLAVVRGLGDDVVVQRPEGVVGEPLVVVLELAGTQVDRDDPDAVAEERVEWVVRDARPADPGALVGAHDRLEGGDEPAGRVLPGGRAVVVQLAVDGEPVGQDDERELAVCGGVRSGFTRGIDGEFRSGIGDGRRPH
jgi:hypothetical protein